MYSLLKAIRARLISDNGLTGMVNAKDITSSYNAEYANYPCIVLSIMSGGSSYEINNITRVILGIDIYSDKNKEQLWIIYEQVKSLLQNQERNITDSSCVAHFIYETKVYDNQYDSSCDVWHLTAQYEILYSTTGLSVTTGAYGVVYADKALVRAIPSKEVASFRGQVSLDISFENNMSSERERFGKTVYYHTGIARLTFNEMIFKSSVLDLLWNIDTDTLGKLNDEVTSATIYQVSQSSYPAYLQVLFQMIKTDDGKRLEIESDKAVCQSLIIPFSRNDFSVFNCQWILLGDSSGKLSMA